MQTDLDLEVIKVKLLCGLADKSRLAILSSLHKTPLTVNKIVEATKLSQSNVSNHLACLKNCGLVSREQSGRFVTYTLSNQNIAHLLSLVESLAAQCASGIDNCAHYTEKPLKV